MFDPENDGRCLGRKIYGTYYEGGVVMEDVWAQKLAAWLTQMGGTTMPTQEEMDKKVSEWFENHNKVMAEEYGSKIIDLEQHNHPLFPVLMRAIEQATKGKGTRHGGDKTPFMEQPWRHYAELHGRGFLTGQAAKKLEEAASIKSGEAFIQEALGAIIYIAMAIINEEGSKKE